MVDKFMLNASSFMSMSASDVILNPFCNPPWIWNETLTIADDLLANRKRYDVPKAYTQSILKCSANRHYFRLQPIHDRIPFVADRFYDKVTGSLSHGYYIFRCPIEDDNLIIPAMLLRERHEFMCGTHVLVAGLIRTRSFV